jgi:hypothetical protein
MPQPPDTDSGEGPVAEPTDPADAGAFPDRGYLDESDLLEQLTSATAEAVLRPAATDLVERSRLPELLALACPAPQPDPALDVAKAILRQGQLPGGPA